MKTFFQKYKHALVLLYGLIYMPWFLWLESRANQPYHVIHSVLDDRIPFVEYFIVPYLLWFLYVAVVFIYMFFQDKREFYQYCLFLFTGMTLFLIISTVFPNGHLLRPASFEKENIFTMATQVLYQADTATNIFPSIHVFNSIASHMAVAHNERLRKNKWIYGSSLILMISIILSTVFLKQHSVVDLFGGVALGLSMDLLIYHTNFVPFRVKVQQKKRRPAHRPKVGM